MKSDYQLQPSSWSFDSRQPFLSRPWPTILDQHFPIYPARSLCTRCVPSVSASDEAPWPNALTPSSANALWEWGQPSYWSRLPYAHRHRWSRKGARRCKWIWCRGHHLRLIRYRVSRRIWISGYRSRWLLAEHASLLLWLSCSLLR